MGEAAFALPWSSRWSKPRDEWSKDFTDAEIRRALERLELTAREHMLLERLCILSLQEGYAFMGQEKLAALLRCSERTLRDTITSLCDRELLEVTRTRDGLQYRPQWEAIGLEGPGSERERSGQRPAKSAGSNRQNLPVSPYRSRIGSKTSSSRAYAPSPQGLTPVSAPPAAPQATLSEASSERDVAAVGGATSQKAPEAGEKVRGAEDVPAAVSPPPSPPKPLREATAAPSRAKMLRRTEFSPGVGVAMLSALTAMPGRRMGRRHEAPSAGVLDETAEPVRSNVLVEPQELALSAAHTLGLPPPPADLILAPIDPLARVSMPTAVVVASPDRQAQVLEKFGPEAHADVLDVLGSWPARQSPDAAMDALDRLLEMEPSEIQKSAGACFRSYLRLASAGQLRLAKTHPRGGTQQGRLVRALDLAEQHGDQERIVQVREQLWEYGVARREQVQALRQLQPQEAPFFSVAAPPPRALAVPRVKSLPAPATHDLHAEAEALRAQLALPIFPTKRAQLERELADVEAALANQETTHAQQGQQTRPGPS